MRSRNSTYEGERTSRPGPTWSDGGRRADIPSCRVGGSTTVSWSALTVVVRILDGGRLRRSTLRNARNRARFFAYFSLWILASQGGSAAVEVNRRRWSTFRQPGRPDGGRSATAIRRA